MKNSKDLLNFLKSNGFIEGFRGGSATLINNFLHDTTSELTKQKYIDVDIDDVMKHIGDPNYLNEHSKIITESIIYSPLTPSFINQIIQIDEVFRASKLVNEPLTVFRGAPRIDKNALNGIVSTSTDIDIATDFYKGALVKIDLPKGFPYIKLFEIENDSIFENEKEVILPPCDFKITNTFTLPHKDYPDKFPTYYKVYELTVTPKNLAECLLNRMKNPPKDYFDLLIEQNKKDFKMAMKLLKEYVNHYVKKDRFKFLTDTDEFQPNN